MLFANSVHTKRRETEASLYFIIFADLYDKIVSVVYGVTE